MSPASLFAEIINERSTPDCFEENILVTQGHYCRNHNALKSIANWNRGRIVQEIEKLKMRIEKRLDSAARKSYR